MKTFVNKVKTNMPKAESNVFSLKHDPKQWILWIIAIGIYFVLQQFQLPNFSAQAQSALSVFGVAAFLWITSAFPIAVTGFIVLMLLPMSGALTSHDTYAAFGNHAVFFILGAFILASPVMRSGLSTRLAVTIIAYFGRGPVSLMASIFVLSTLLSFIISEHAVAAMLFPIVMEIVKAANIKPGSRFGFAAFISMAWGAVIGGTATLLGGARAPLALGLLNSNTHYDISFAQWTLWTIPTVLMMMIFSIVLIYFMIRKTQVCVSSARAQLELHHTSLGKFSFREGRTCAVVIITVLLWIFYGKSVGLDIVAIIGVILAFVSRITTWDEVQADVQWNIIVMYGSAIALSTALSTTGAAHGIVDYVIQSGFATPITIFIAMLVLAFVLTEAMSNAAAVAVLMPIGLVLCNQYNIDPRAMTLAIATSAGLTFLLPVSTPAMAIATSVEFVPQSKALRWGIIIKVLGFIALLATTFFYWPHFGLTL